jgi:conjugative transfer pilus assembly protein TraH
MNGIFERKYSKLERASKGKKVVKGILLCVILITSILITKREVSAGVGKEMENLFSAMGGGANVTKAGSYKTQSGGYYTGGSIYARVPTRNYQLVNFQPPSIKAGCNGIDAHLGSFSHIGKDLINALRTIPSNAAGYAFNLALQTYVPQVYNTMQKLQDIAREINSLNINSCETASALVGGLWPKSDRVDQQICQSLGTNTSVFKDWAEARRDCAETSKRKEVNSDKEGKHKDQLGDEFNIAWAAIKKQFGTLEGESLEAAEFFMSISGTIIRYKEGSGESAELKTIEKATLIKEAEVLDTLMFGESKSVKQATIYSCGDKEKCLKIKDKPLPFDKSKALVPQIEKMLRGIATKMRTHVGNLTDQEMNLINNTQIPILKIVAVQNAFMVGNSVINIHEYAEPIAYDYILGYLESILDFVAVNIDELAKVQMDGTYIENFKRNISDTRKLITDKRFGSYQRMLTAISVIEKTNLIEKKLQHMFSSYKEVIGNE